jgi:hypothetical protein
VVRFGGEESSALQEGGDEDAKVTCEELKRERARAREKEGERQRAKRERERERENAFFLWSAVTVL